MKHILFVIGKSQYDSTMVFLKEIQNEMERMGARVTVINSYETKEDEILSPDVFEQTYDVILTMNGMLLEPGSKLARILFRDGVLYTTMMMDHPFIHHQRMKNTYENQLILCPDMRHAEYIRRFYPQIKVSDFLPHAGCSARHLVDYDQRSIAISFMGSYGNPKETLAKMMTYPPQMVQLFREVISVLLTYTEKTLEEAVISVLTQHNIHASDQELADVMSEFHLVDRYIRNYYRDGVIRVLLEAGIKVDVYGDGWEKLAQEGFDSLVIHGRVDYRESLEIIGDSKIHLNVMPWFKEGSHDRVFTAMLCGAVCLTDGSKYLEQVCTEGENIAFYRLDELEKLPQMVHSLLDGEGEKLARKALSFARERHTWANRAREWMELMG